MTHCKVCGNPLSDKTELFCPRHRMAMLKKMEASGYLEPLKVSTIDGPNQHLSRARFLTVQDNQ